MSHSFAIVVVTWNSAETIERCLAGAVAQQPDELVIVDNGSEDDTVEIVRRRAPQAELLRCAHNTGFAAGSNRGIAATRAPFVLTLNHDAILSAEYAATLVAVLEREPRAASAVGKLIFDRGPQRLIDSAGIILRRHALSPLDRGHGEPDRGQFDRAERVFGCSAAAALYRRAALDGLGSEIFDEDLFAYYEDVDLAWRLGRRGWHHLYEPSTIAVHERSGPGRQPAGIEARAFANRYLVWLKNESLPRFALFAPAALAWESARLARRAVTRPRVLRGLPRALRLAPAMLGKRWRGA